MAPVRRNGVLIKGSGPDSVEGRIGRHAHSTPGQDATEDCICLRKSPEPSAPLPAPGTSLSGLSKMRKFDFFFGALYEHLRLETIRYGSQFAPGFQLSIGQMKQVLGILLLSGYQPVPKWCHYWMTQEDVHHPFVASTMPRNRFEEIVHFFH